MHKAGKKKQTTEAAGAVAEVADDSSPRQAVAKTATVAIQACAAASRGSSAARQI